MKNKKEIKNEALRTWVALNDALMMSDEKACRKLLDEELKGRKRRMFILRIHSRINKVRADRERMELEKRL